MYSDRAASFFSILQKWSLKQGAEKRNITVMRTRIIMIVRVISQIIAFAHSKFPVHLWITISINGSTDIDIGNG
jgi:hypothetical protein